MKNLMIFINPSGSFTEEASILIKIQIDNSLSLGWKRQDLILATNFEYEYNGIKSVVVSSTNFTPFYVQGSKHKTVLELVKRGYIKDGELYWLHDLDVYQSEVITESELKMGSCDMVMTDYGRMKRLNAGSIFFKKSAQDIFKGMAQTESLLKIGDEQALMVLIKGIETERRGIIYEKEVVNKIPCIKNIGKRIKRINISYNFTYFDLRYCYQTAIKPIKVVHFHPMGSYIFIDNLLNYYMNGKNELGTVLMSERLIKIFRSHETNIIPVK